MHVGWEIAHETIFHSVHHSILQRLVRGVFWNLHMSLFIDWCPLKIQRDYFYSIWEVRSTKNDTQVLLILRGLLHRKVQSTKCFYCLNSLYKLIFFLNSDRSYSYMIHCATDSTSAFISETALAFLQKFCLERALFSHDVFYLFAEYRSQKIEQVDLSSLHCIMI